jgi:Glycosyltransferases involved in cell wall biogenesis
VKRPLFSVLIPSRNRLELLRDAVDSVLIQEGDFEIVISDNASDEPYTDYVASLGAVAARSVRCDEAVPVTENWNRALAASSGQYIIMLGDDDALAPGWLAYARTLLQQFNNPDVVYTMAYHYAYPGAVPSRPSGYFSTIDNSDLFRTHAHPYLLSPEVAASLGRQVLRFRHWFGFNSQHFTWNRAFLEFLADSGSLFQGPYPDYYAAAVTMLKARTILVVPSPHALIGISRKSFGFYYHQRQYDAGQAMLGNDPGSRRGVRDGSAEVDAALSFPGTLHYRNWLLSALLVAQNLGLSGAGAVDLRRYRRLQILEMISARNDKNLAASERTALVDPYLHPTERRLLQQINWLERLAKRLPVNPDAIRDSLGEMAGIYAPEVIVTEHDIGAHSSIADAVRWLTLADNGARPGGSFTFQRRRLRASGTRTGQSTGIESSIPVLHPLSAMEDGTTIAVVYLARSADGAVDSFRPFIESYRAHDAGLPHDLIVLRKGLHQRAGSQTALSGLLKGIPHRTVDVSDDGFDIQAYLKISRRLRHDRVCFFNTFSEIKADNWLHKLNAPFERPDVGMTGATGSYESLFSSLTLIDKVLWLTIERNVKYSPALYAQFRTLLRFHAPKWVRKRHNLWKRAKQSIRRLFVDRSFKTSKRTDAEFVRYWENTLAKPGGSRYAFRDMRPFPNPHLRSNAFMIRRALLLEFGFELDNTKEASNRFESGPEGLPARLAERNLLPILVGADGRAFEVADWPNSNTFRLGAQENILVADNHVKLFSQMNKDEKAMHQMITWGGYLHERDRAVIGGGVSFERGDLSLVQSKRHQDLTFSIVLLTHYGPTSLREALYTIHNQPGANWNCIVFDNGSDDTVEKVVREFADDRIRYERSSELLSLTESWNRAIDFADGDYIALIGDDGGIVPDYFTKLADVIQKVGQPDVIYSSLYQFVRPMIDPAHQEGYVLHLRNALFFQNHPEAFLLNKRSVTGAIGGSLKYQLNFTYNTQAFTFSKAFLAKVRRQGKVFYSPLPDVYVAHMALAVGEKIAVLPRPLTIAGASRGSLSLAPFNTQEEADTAPLDADVLRDEVYESCARHLLPGRAYHTDFLLAMAHVVRALGGEAPGSIDYERYRRLQVYALATSRVKPTWMRKPVGKQAWSKLTASEKLWGSFIGLLHWQATKRRNGIAKNLMKKIGKDIEMYDVCPIEANQLYGRFGQVSELFDALAAGTYPEA